MNTELNTAPMSSHLGVCMWCTTAHAEAFEEYKSHMKIIRTSDQRSKKKH